MKALLFAAALVTGSGIAIAQTAPATDARGIPVVSKDAVAPSGANQTVPTTPGVQLVPAPNQQAVFAPQPATETFPPCTRERTDRCVQTYERGVTGRR
jgi:hypothetical protein